MAALTIQSLIFSSSSSSSRLVSPISTTLPRRRLRFQIRSQQSADLLNGFGARDPFPAEVASNFSEKVGNMDTEHKILIPTASALSLTQQNCSPISPSQPPMSVADAKAMLPKVVGWWLLDEEDGLKLRCVWKVKDSESGAELISRITKLAEGQGHSPSLRLEEPNQVIAILWTPSIGGLSMNDFIVAAKIDEVKTSDLVPRRRVWA